MRPAPFVRLLIHAGTAAAALMLSAAPVGCQSIKSALASTDRPTANITGANLQNVSVDALSLVLDVDVSNPYAVALPVTGLDYKLASAGQQFLDGAAPSQGSIPAKGSRTLQVPVRIAYQPLMAVLTGVKPGGVVPYTADLALTVDAPALGPIRLPVSKEGKLPIPAVPDVSIDQIEWGTLSLDQASASVALKVKNTNQFKADLAAFNYALALGGQSVASGKLDNALSLNPGQEGVINLPISFSPKSFGLGAFQMLTGKSGGYSIGGDMKLATPFGPIELPYKKSGDTAFRKK